MKLNKLAGKGLEYLFRDPRSQIIYFRRYTKRTGEILRSLKTKELKEAKAERDLLLASIEPRKRVNAPLALELFDGWFESRKVEDISDATLTSIAASRAHLAPFLETILITEITSKWWANTYIKEVRAKTHDKRKFFNDRKWLTAFMRAQVEAGILARAPQLKNPDKKTDVGRAFSLEEVDALIHGAQNEDLRLAILMGATMGMRRLEIFALKVDRVDLRARVIRLRQEDTKIRQARAFAIAPACWTLIEKRCKRPGAVWVFPSRADVKLPLHKDGFKTAWTNLRRALAIRGRFHDLRHTFLTNAFKAPNANAAFICHYAGLSLEVAQRVYLHLNEKDTAGVATLVNYSTEDRSERDSGKGKVTSDKYLQ